MAVLQAAGSSTFVATVSATVDDVLYSLPSSSSGTFTLHVDLSNMTVTDTVQLRVYQTIWTGGTSRVAYFAQFAGAQPTDNRIQISVPISTESMSDAGVLKFTLRQIAGTGRTFAWKVLSY